MFKIIEKFISIDGEGPTSGEISTFIRFQHCNLRCSWCDTEYSWHKDNISELLSVEEIYQYIKESKTKNVTLTGGEPLLQEDIHELLEVLDKDEELSVHIETNGSINIAAFKKRFKRGNIKYIVDYKLPKSKMSDKMCLDNIYQVNKDDVYKFVIADNSDLKEAYEIIERYNLTEKCLVYFSPVLDKIQVQDIVEFMKEKNLNNVRLQLQLHKIIWSKDARGV